MPIYRVSWKNDNNAAAAGLMGNLWGIYGKFGYFVYFCKRIQNEL